MLVGDLRENHAKKRMVLQHFVQVLRQKSLDWNGCETVSQISSGSLCIHVTDTSIPSASGRKDFLSLHIIPCPRKRCDLVIIDRRKWSIGPSP